MIAAVADTHAVVWYVYADSRFSMKAKSFMDILGQEGGQVGVSVISLVEITYLVEKKRVDADTYQRVLQALSDPASILAEVAVTSHTVEARRRIPRAAVPDMPDRIIAATALHLSVPLISRDAKIQVSGLTTIW